jgi:tetratricopeptide (TPR) repeat protein
LKYNAFVRRKGALTAAGVVLLGGGAVLFRSHRAPQSAAPVPAASQYVDGAVCAGCHVEIARAYRQTGMGRSFFRPRPENTIEDYDNRNQFYHGASERYYRMFRREGKLYQRRHQIGFGRHETNVIEKEVDYVLGSGNHARSYLHRTSEGKLVQLPVGWYAEKGGFWAMNPGYDRPDHPDFRRVITYDCMFCHNGYPVAPSGTDESGGEPIYPEQLPEGIDCQRCHGPGRAHVEAAAKPSSTSGSIRGAILNPARLSRERQLEVCMQCHLESTSRSLPHAIRRYGRESFSYRPGEPLGDFIVHFDQPARAGYDDKFEIAHAAYRLRKSACFLKSELTCTTCHDPHNIPRGEQAIRHYVAVCRRCHTAAHATESRGRSDCLQCHMPRRRTDDVVHVVMTDHDIQRRKPPRDLLAPLRETRQTEEIAYRGEVVLYYPAQLPVAPESEVYLATAQVQNGANLSAGIPQLEQALEKYRPARHEAYFELAEAYSKAGEREKAVHWYEEALRRRPDYRPTLRQLALAFSRTGRLAQAATILEQAVALNPADGAAYSNLGEVYLMQEKREQAEAALRKALSINPELPEAYNLLARALSQKGDMAPAEAAFRDALRVQPDYALAHNNLANLLVQSGDLRQARYHFEKAIAIDPKYATAYYNYGLALAQNGLYEQAQAKLETAVRVDPGFAQAHNDLGNVLATTGRLERALAHYKEAIKLKPDLAEAHFNLGTALGHQRRDSEAKAHLLVALRLNPGYYEAHFNLARIPAQEGNTADARLHYQQAAESPNPEVRRSAQEALR